MIELEQQLEGYTSADISGADGERNAAIHVLELKLKVKGIYGFHFPIALAFKIVFFFTIVVKHIVLLPVFCKHLCEKHSNDLLG